MLFYQSGLTVKIPKFYRIFLNERGGNPNKTNGRKETALHCVCMEKNPQYYPVQRRRMECLSMILQWRGAELKDGEIERADLAAVDEVCLSSVKFINGPAQFKFLTHI